MSLVLTNMILWPFLLLIAVPLLIHLFARAKPPVYNFSSIEFILRIIRTTMRIRRPQDWLLLLARTILYTAVILLFLRPVFFARRELASPFQKKNIVLIVDATASMAWSDGAQTRFAAACAEGSEVLSGLSTRDTANIVWLKSAPEAVFPEMGVNLSFLQDALRKARVTTEAGNVDEAFRLAIRMLDGAEGRREICVLSDFQKTTWEDAALPVPRGIALVKIKIGAAEAENAAVSDIRFEPPEPLIGEDMTIYCEVSNYSPQPRRKTVFLSLGESRQSQDVMVPPWGRVSAVFAHRVSVAGTHPVAASLSEDPFSGDDRRWALLTIRETIPVGILAAEPATAAAWRKVLNSLGWARTETLTTDDLAGSLPFDFLMLAGWNGAHRSNLEKKLGEGCAIVCMPADGLAVSEFAGLCGKGQPAMDGAFRMEKNDRVPRKLRIANEKDALFAVFAGGERGDLSRATFNARLVFPTGILHAAGALLSYDDGAPALARTADAHPLYLWNMPLAPDESSLASEPEIVPFLAELLLTSRAMSGRRGALSDYLPGEPVALQLGPDAILPDLSLRKQDSAAIRIRELRGTAVADEVLDPGLYEWQLHGKQLAHATVNFPSSESDLRVMNRTDIELPGSVAIAGGSKARQLRDGLQIWPHLLVAAVGFAIVEGLLLLWVERR